MPDELSFNSSRGRAALAATVAASGMASLDATVVNVALPHIGDDLGAGLGSLQWVLTGYLLSLGSLILLGGALGDRFGRRRVFLVGTGWFVAASLLCGAAPTIEALIAARVLQGVGAALLTPGSLAILQASFREEERSKAVGAWSGLGGVAGAIGPFVGGWVVDGPGWRWAFLANLPVAVIVVICARVSIPESRDPHAARALDVKGSCLALVSVGAATWALTEAGRRGWSDPSVLAAGALALVVGAAFVAHLTRANDPLVPPSLFQNRAFTVTNLATVLLYAALGVAFFLIAYQLQVAAGWSALESGIALLPATILMLVGSAASGALAERIGPRTQLSVGPLVTAVGLILLSRVGTDVSWTRDVLPGALLFGLGLVTFVAPLTATVMASVTGNHINVGSAVNNAVARTSSLAALSVIPVVSGLSAAETADAVTDAFRVALIIAAVLAAAAAPVAFIGLRRGDRADPGARRMHCAVDGPPLHADRSPSRA